MGTVIQEPSQRHQCNPSWLSPAHQCISLVSSSNISLRFRTLHSSSSLSSDARESRTPASPPLHNRASLIVQGLPLALRFAAFQVSMAAVRTWRTVQAVWIISTLLTAAYSQTVTPSNSTLPSSEHTYALQTAEVSMITSFKLDAITPNARLGSVGPHYIAYSNFSLTVL